MISCEDQCCILFSFPSFTFFAKVHVQDVMLPFLTNKHVKGVIHTPKKDRLCVPYCLPLWILKPLVSQHCAAHTCICSEFFFVLILVLPLPPFLGDHWVLSFMLLALAKDFWWHMPSLAELSMPLS